MQPLRQISWAEPHTTFQSLGAKHIANEFMHEYATLNKMLSTGTGNAK
jgi:hypothetical protein